MARLCVSDAGECRHHLSATRREVEKCLLMPKGITFGKRYPQRFCPIEGGSAFHVRFNYDVLARIDVKNRTKWLRIKEFQDYKESLASGE